RSSHFSFCTRRRSPRSTLFPYTTLFRSTTSPRVCPWTPMIEPPFWQPSGGGGPGPGGGGPGLGPSGGGGPSRGGPQSLHFGGSGDRKSTRLNSSHRTISYAVFCLKKTKQ